MQSFGPALQHEAMRRHAFVSSGRPSQSCGPALQHEAMRRHAFVSSCRSARAAVMHLHPVATHAFGLQQGRVCSFEQARRAVGRAL